MIDCKRCDDRRVALKKLFISSIAAFGVRKAALWRAALLLYAPQATARARQSKLKDQAIGNRRSMYGDREIVAIRSAWGGSTDILQLTLHVNLDTSGGYPQGPRNSIGTQIILSHLSGLILPRVLSFSWEGETYTFNHPVYLACGVIEAWYKLDGFKFSEWKVAAVRTMLQDGKFYACGSNCYAWAGQEKYPVDFDFQT